MVYDFLILSSLLLWCGCIIAISFIEAWLKFRAPGITVPLGLAIGKLVFRALNKTEWILVTIILFIYLLGPSSNTALLPYFLIPIVILLLQTFWLLPALDTRAAAVIQGNIVPKSRLHVYFVLGDAL
jgi:hypothetical protein